MDVLGLLLWHNKRPISLLEKEWGSINTERYCERMVPLVHGWLRLSPSLQYMQNGAPSGGCSINFRGASRNRRTPKSSGQPSHQISTQLRLPGTK